LVLFFWRRSFWLCGGSQDFESALFIEVVTMDPQLKQRLIGVTVIVALIVIFVPMFFEKADDAHPAKMLGGIPQIPDEVRESELELPNAVEDVAHQAEARKSDSAHATSSPSGYTVIPLSDPEPAQKETSAKSSVQKTPPPAQVEASEEEGFAEPVRPIAPVPPGKQSKTAGDSKGQAKSRNAVPAAPAEKVVIMDDEPDGVPVSAVQNAQAPAPVSSSKTSVPQAKPSNVAKPVPSKPKPVDAPPVSAVAAPAVKPLPTAVSTPAAKPLTVTPPAVKPSAPKVSTPSKPVIDATVSTIPQTAAKPATVAKAEAVSAWVVQTGSFTTEVNAKALVERLRQSKFAAFVEAVQGDGGAVYRVQVGPELDRTHAEQLQKQIEGSVGIKGIVLPHR
jgi:DedD protein